MFLRLPQVYAIWNLSCREESEFHRRICFNGSNQLNIRGIWDMRNFLLLGAAALVSNHHGLNGSPTQSRLLDLLLTMRTRELRQDFVLTDNSAIASTFVPQLKLMLASIAQNAIRPHDVQEFRLLSTFTASSRVQRFSDSVRLIQNSLNRRFELPGQNRRRGESAPYETCGRREFVQEAVSSGNPRSNPSHATTGEGV